MPTAPNTSFIPKRGPAKQSRRSVSRHVHVFTVLSYLIFSATLVATIGVFFYSDYIEKLRQQEIATLDFAISSFDESELERILAMDSRLRQAHMRLDNSVSSVSILEALEVATVRTVALEALTLERDLDNMFVLAAEVSADSFDSTLFQRGVFERNDIIESVEVSELEIVTPDAESEGGRSGVTFIATIGVPVRSVPYVPEANIVIPVPVTPEVASTSVSETTEEENANQETL